MLRLRNAFWPPVVTLLLFSFRPSDVLSLSSTSTSTGPKLPSSIGGQLNSLLQQTKQQPSVSEILGVVRESLWIPSDGNLPPHFQQSIHNDKRQRGAAQALSMLSTCCHTQQDLSYLLENEGFERLLWASAIPSEGVPDSQGRSTVMESLQALQALIGRCHRCGLLSKQNHNSDDASPSIIQKPIETLIQRSLNPDLVQQWSLQQVCQVRWSAKSLIQRLRLPDLDTSILDDRVALLPFDILFDAVDWSKCMNTEHDQDSHTPDTSGMEILPSEDVVNLLKQEIPFHHDVIVTRTGARVQERRATAWIAEEGIGALAYSGKLMIPEPVPPVVSRLMRHVENDCLVGQDVDVRFDCALCNHYPTDEAACKFHTDPEHGTMWDRCTVVVTAGHDRKFAFRPIWEETHWDDWEPDSSSSTALPQPPKSEKMAAITHFCHGDIVVMKEDCNDLFYHAVHAGDSSESSSIHQERVSLVLKRALPRGKSGRGHGLPGQGRRSKGGTANRRRESRSSKRRSR